MKNVISVVISIVPDTASPYADARLLDEPKPMTVPATTTSRIQLAAGM